MFNIRLIKPEDCGKVLDVYRPYVEETAYTFEYEVPTIEDFSKKIEKITAQYPWLVCEYNGEIVGYAYGSTHRERIAYQWSVESTIYMNRQYHRKGIARILYDTLFKILREQGYFSVYAGVLATNNESVQFHKAVGFEEIGLFKNIGYKLEEWHTNLWLQYFLQEHIAAPPVLKTISSLAGTGFLKSTLEEANRKLMRLNSDIS